METEQNTDGAVESTEAPVTENTSDVSQTDQHTAETSPAETQTKEEVDFEKYQSILSENEKLRKDLDGVSHYQEFDDILSQDPDKFQRVKDILYGQAEDNVDPIQSVVSRVERIEAASKANYLISEYNRMYTESGVEFDKNLMEEMVADHLAARNNGDLLKADERQLKDSFDNIRKVFESVAGKANANYVTEKNKDKVPVNKGGAVVTPAAPELHSHEDRTRFAAERLRASKG